MKKLQFNNLDLILDWIREPSHKEHLFLIEAAIAKAKGSSKSAFSVGDKVSFGRPNGRKHFGVVEKLNPSKAVIAEYLNGKNAHRKWRVPYSMMTMTEAA
tara:strand:+ start:218 stop:517 length:300 start_codon:yes stop_codon:yes gene_type:complete